MGQATGWRRTLREASSLPTRTMRGRGAWPSLSASRLYRWLAAMPSTVSTCIGNDARLSPCDATRLGNSWS